MQYVSIYDRLSYLAQLDSKIEVFQVQTGEHITTLSNHFDKVNCCVFAPYGMELYSAGSDAIINLWEPQKDEDEPEQEAVGKLMRAGEEEGDNWSISEEEQF